MEEGSSRDIAQRLIERLRNDPAQQAMLAEVAERHRHLREKFDGVDVTTLGPKDWEDWLSVHNVFDRERAKGLRAQHRHGLKQAARAQGRPWTRNDPRAADNC